jgi:TolB-like protein/Tfp pilus assembly protein PilF
MTESPGRLSRFWKEVRRRRVLRSLAIYLGSAFIILEASTIIFPRWDFPDWTIDLVLWILVVGAVVNLVISWHYDITSEGLRKTIPLKEVPEGAKKSESRGWKAATYASLVVIIALVLFNVFNPVNSLKAGDIQSLVVLPFENFTGDDQLENMVAGMHSILVGDLMRLSGLRVKGRTTSKLYKDTDMSAKDIASELNVEAVLEASVICLGDTICMQFRLIGTSGEEEQLWVEEYSVYKGEILNFNNRLTKTIAKEVHIELTDEEEQILSQDRAADREAIDAYIRSHTYWGDLSPEALEDAHEFLTKALEKDPEWATLYAAMGVIWVARMQIGVVDTETGRQLITENLDRARELDPNFADKHFIEGVVHIWPDWEWEQGEQALIKALAVNPNHSLARMYYAHLLLSLQRMDEAREQAKLALELDPRNPLILTLYSVILKGAGLHEAVLEYLEQALAIDPDHSFTHGQLGRAYYNLGMYKEELEMQERLLVHLLGRDKVPDLQALYTEHGRLKAYQQVADLWNMYKQDHSISPVGMAVNYYRAGRFSEAIDELERGYDLHNPNMPYVGTGTRFEHLHDSTRFLAILDSMNLPHPKKQ